MYIPRSVVTKAVHTEPTNLLKTETVHSNASSIFNLRFNTVIENIAPGINITKTIINGVHT